MRTLGQTYESIVPVLSEHYPDAHVTIRISADFDGFDVAVGKREVFAPHYLVSDILLYERAEDWEKLFALIDGDKQ